MKLFLSSAGIQPETKDAFLSFLGRDPKGMKVAFIPTAKNYTSEVSKYIEISKNQLHELGFEVEEVDIEFFPKENLRNKLESFDMIYMSGGNTFYLLNQMRKSGLDKYLSDLLKEKIYFGTSAGSILVAPDIKVCTWDGVDVNDVGLTDLSGMNLIPFALFVHYEENENRELVEHESKNYPLTLFCLSDQQAVIVNDDKWEIVGIGNKVIFEK